MPRRLPRGPRSHRLDIDHGGDFPHSRDPHGLHRGRFAVLCRLDGNKPFRHFVDGVWRGVDSIAVASLRALGPIPLESNHAEDELEHSSLQHLPPCHLGGLHNGRKGACGALVAVQPVHSLVDGGADGLKVHRTLRPGIAPRSYGGALHVGVVRCLHGPEGLQRRHRVALSSVGPDCCDLHERVAAAIAAEGEAALEVESNASGERRPGASAVRLRRVEQGDDERDDALLPELGPSRDPAVSRQRYERVSRVDHPPGDGRTGRRAPVALDRRLRLCGESARRRRDVSEIRADRADEVVKGGQVTAALLAGARLFGLAGRVGDQGLDQSVVHDALSRSLRVAAQAPDARSCCTAPRRHKAT
mmetsp:Transcript_17532/g.42070  ORF Transcript_17532/g.42070 Transcript_17532/m.42070 type:complete len:360 (-) Transcript_17532:2836-3915(-)